MRHAVPVALLTLLLPIPLRAQDSTGPIPESNAVTVGIGQLLVDHSGIHQSELLLRFAPLVPDRLSGDLSLGMFPGLSTLVLALEGGPAWNAALPGATLVFRTGLTGIFAPSGGAVLGGYLGAGVILRVGDRAAMRFDVARQGYLGGEDGIGAWQVSVGFGVLSRPH